MDEVQEPGDEPAQVTCSGGITLPSLAMLFGQRPEQPEGQGDE